jgi:hypothetical protein
MTVARIWNGTQWATVLRGPPGWPGPRGQQGTVGPMAEWSARIAAGTWRPAWPGVQVGTWAFPGQNPAAGLALSNQRITRLWLPQACDKAQPPLNDTGWAFAVYADTPSGPGARTATSTRDTAFTGFPVWSVAIPAGFSWLAIGHAGFSLSTPCWWLNSCNPYMIGFDDPQVNMYTTQINGLVPNAWGIQQMGGTTFGDPWATGFTVQRSEVFPWVWLRAA